MNTPLSSSTTVVPTGKLECSDLNDYALPHRPEAVGRQCSLNGISTTLLTDKAEWEIRSWLPQELVADKLVVFPDVCPGKPLPTGTALVTSIPTWRALAISDCGCGMQLLRSDLSINEFKENPSRWDEVGIRIKRNSGKLGDLGGGNHFLDALQCYETESVYFLIHTGSRLESEVIDHLKDQPAAFDKEFARTVSWARSNRDAIARIVKSVFGKSINAIWDKPHNTFENLGGGSVLIRKGVVAACPGDEVVIPSSMTGDVSLVTATESVSHVLNSVSHGTGRILPRSEAKELQVDGESLRKEIYIPDYIKDTSLRTESPACYRNLNDCLSLLSGIIEEKQRFKVVAYLGHL